jgi:hypothetical protein
MSKRKKVAAAIAVPGFMALGAIAAGAAGSPAVRPASIITPAAADSSSGQAQLIASTGSGAATNPDANTHPSRFGSVLDALVKDGTLTAAQRTKVDAAIDAQEAKDTPADETLEHSDAATWASNALDSLVKDGTITAGQQGNIKAAIAAAPDAGRGGPGFGHGGPGRAHGDVGSALDGLVTDKTITADQQAKIAAAYKAQETNDTDTQEQLEHSDRAAWLDLTLNPLVKDGTITSAQAAKVKTALSTGGPGGPGGRGWPGGRGGDHGRPNTPAQGGQNG